MQTSPQCYSGPRSKILVFMGQPRPLLSFILGLFKQTSLQFYNKLMFIQYIVPRFKPTTFGSPVSSHHQLTRAPTRIQHLCFPFFLHPNLNTIFSCFNIFKKSLYHTLRLFLPFSISFSNLFLCR